MKTTIKNKEVAALRFGTKLMFKNVYFIMFLAVLGLLYINNSQRGERKLMTIYKLEKEVQQKRWEYMSLRKDLMSQSSPSQLAKDLDGQVVFPEKGPRMLREPKS